MIIKAKNIVKTFRVGGIENQVLKGIDFSVKRGEFVAIRGRSGAGKSTLLYQLSLLDIPDTGEIIIDGIDTHTLSDADRTSLRLSKLGYVFQDYANLPELTALENVMLPLLMLGESFSNAKKRATESLDKVGLKERINNLPSQLSGGEQQRVSIARAVVNTPSILFADEPTANLDSETAKKIMDLFQEIHKAGQTIVMITHDDDVHTGRTVRINDGKVVK
jgi:putative ABC transport system ATP-binding protein